MAELGPLSTLAADHLLRLPLIWLILLVSLAMWALIIERQLYLRWTLPRRRREHRRLWSERRDHHSWHAKRIREGLIAAIAIPLRRRLPLIETLNESLPLLGLLGTVSGMIKTFQALQLAGGAPLPAFSAGITEALVSTLAGLVCGLSGIYFCSSLRERSAREIERFAASLEFRDANGTPLAQ